MGIKAEDVVYAIKVNSLEQDEAGVAVLASCTVSATYEGHVGQCTLSVNLLPPAKDAELVPALEIEQSQAVPWVIAAFNAPGKVGIEGMKREALADLVRQQAPKTSAIPLTWTI